MEDVVEKELEVPAVPIYSFRSSFKGSLPRLKYQCLICVATLFLCLLILGLNSLTHIPGFNGIAKVGLIGSPLLFLCSVWIMKLQRYEIQIQGPEIRYYGKKGAILVRGPLDKITSLTSRGSILQSKYRSYFVSFGGMKIFGFTEGIEDRESLIRMIENGSGKSFNRAKATKH